MSSRKKLFNVSFKSLLLKTLNTLALERWRLFSSYSFSQQTKPAGVSDTSAVLYVLASRYLKSSKLLIGWSSLNLFCSNKHHYMLVGIDNNYHITLNICCLYLQSHIPSFSLIEFLTVTFQEFSFLKPMTSYILEKL